MGTIFDHGDLCEMGRAPTDSSSHMPIMSPQRIMISRIRVTLIRQTALFKIMLKCNHHKKSRKKDIFVPISMDKTPHGPALRKQYLVGIVNQYSTKKPL